MTAFDTTGRTSWNVDYTHRLERAGRHLVKGGLGYQYATNDIDSRYPGGYVDIFWGIPAVFPGSAGDRGAYGYYTVTNRGLFGKAGANIVSLYLQDQWQIAHNLTLNIGMRSEHEKVPAYRTEMRKHVFDFGFGEKIAPRLGLSYDVTGHGRSKLYASWGRYFDWTKYRVARNLFGGEVWCIYYRSIDDPTHPITATLTTMPGRDLWDGCRRLSRPPGTPFRNNRRRREADVAGQLQRGLRLRSQSAHGGDLPLRAQQSESHDRGSRCARRRQRGVFHREPR